MSETIKKEIRTTSEVNDHIHTYNDESSGFTSEVNGHRHPYEVAEDGTVKFLEADNHIHEEKPKSLDVNRVQKRDSGEMIWKQVSFEFTKIEETDDEFFRFEGLGSTFGNIDRDGDIIERGAFVKSLSQMMPKLLWMHKIHEPVGVYTEAFESEKGLVVKGKMPKSDTLVSGRVIPQITVGSVRDLSIGFSITGSREEKVDDEFIRRITEVTLWEVSLVTIPSNPLASLTTFKSMKNMETLSHLFNDFKKIGDVSTFLKEFGLSNKESTSLINAIKRVSQPNAGSAMKEVADAFKKLSDTMKK